MPSFPVRPATREDIPVMAGFQQTMARESEGMALQPEVLLQGITRVFDQSPALGQYWVLEEPVTGVLVGMCMITAEWSDWHNRPYWWFQSVYLLPQYRGQGLLEALMSHIESTAHAQGIQELRLYVETENRRAIRAYDKLGFHQGHYQVMQKRVM